MELPHQYRHRNNIGEEVYFNHEECGDTRSRLYVKRTPKGWLHHCHNCAPEMSGFTAASGIPTPSETLREVERPKENQVVTDGEVKLPYDFTTEIPPRGLLWLEKYGLTEDEIQRYSFGFSSSYGRLLLPVFDPSSGDLIYWQGRCLDNQQPKYINVKKGGRDVYFQGHTRFDRENTIDSRCCVLVEDILSAIKVGRVTSSIGLLGSYIPPSLTRKLVNFDKVYIWLDRDKAKESIKYSRRLNALLGKPVMPVITDLDPKEYSTEEICKILNVTSF